MKREEIKICVLRVGGTNCDAETQRAIQEFGVQAQVLHVNELIKKPNLLDFHALVFPGGFSFGDYVRSGVIFARMLSAKLGKEMNTFVDEGRPILGICNGFQILVEYGLLPGFEGMSDYPEASLAKQPAKATNANGFTLEAKTRENASFQAKSQQAKFYECRLHTVKGDCCFQKRKKRKCWLNSLMRTCWCSVTAVKTVNLQRGNTQLIQTAHSVTSLEYAIRKVTFSV